MSSGFLCSHLRNEHRRNNSLVSRGGKMSVRSRKRRQWPLLAGACLLAACVVILVGKSPFGTPFSWKDNTPAVVVATPLPTPPPREAVEFRMLDFDRGWVKYADGIARTEDGGAQWQEARNRHHRRGSRWRFADRRADNGAA